MSRAAMSVSNKNPYSSSRQLLPSAWMEGRGQSARNAAALMLLKIEGLRIRYVGEGTDDSQAATVRANHPAPIDCPLYYFEVEIISKGRSGFIGVGFQRDDVQLGRLPGWEAHSYGYHGDDGCAFSGSGSGRPFGPSFGAGDVIGALLNRADRTISFYRNGLPLGVAFSNVQDERLYPCVGMRTVGEEVSARFGVSGADFETDVAALLIALQERVVTGIKELPLPLLSSTGTALLPQLVHDHLIHHRCWKTAAILSHDLLSRSVHGAGASTSGSTSAGGTAPATDAGSQAEIQQRQAIYDAVVVGRVDEAMAMLRASYSVDVLKNSPSLEFRLRLQHFLEGLRAASMAASGAANGQNGEADMAVVPGASNGRAADGGVGSSGGSNSALEAALTYGRTVLTPMPKTEADEELFADALTLLAYEDPLTGPAGHLLQPSHRAGLAEELNGAIMRWLGHGAASPLEMVFQQASACVEELKRLQSHRAMGLSVRHMCLLSPSNAT